MAIENITFEEGYIVLTTQPGGIPKRWAIADILRAADIPALTYSQVATITTLANMTAILIRTLMKRGILDESFVDDCGMNWDLEALVYAIEQMGGSFHNPDLDDV